MDKSNNEKAEPGKQAEDEPSSKRRAGKQDDESDFGNRLDALGLKIVNVTADGNCLFRALADQIEGDEDKHQKYRKKIVRFMKKNRETFEPFVEDEVPFHEYCQSMGVDGTWAGHMELQAASLVTQSNICIHRPMSPRWYIQNFDINEARMIHLSYHDGEHYNSVRSKSDSCCGPARPIVIKDDADRAEKFNQPKAAAMKSKEEGSSNVGHEESITLLKAGSGCSDAGEVEKVGGDDVAAVEVVASEQGSLDQNEDDEHLEQQREDKACKPKVAGNDAAIADNENDMQSDEKKLSGNEVCPCGSKKKYKSCCGSAAGKRSARAPVNQTLVYERTRRDRKQGRKGGSTAVTSSIQSNGGPPDMGGLCI